MGKLFAKSGVYPSYKMFSGTHFMFILICAVCIFYALHKSENMDKKTVRRTIKICTVILWSFETVKIIFNWTIGNSGSPNTYIPLYFCSIALYSGILSGFCKGRAKRFGDVFLMVGGIIGGCAYILSPCTTAGIYPAFHFITIQSYIHHSIMVYLGFLLIITDYTELSLKDIKYYTTTVVCVSVVAYIINYFLGTNLMFVSRNYPGTVIELVYNMGPHVFPFVITFWQAVPPFYVIYGVYKWIHNRKEFISKLSLEEEKSECRL